MQSVLGYFLYIIRYEHIFDYCNTIYRHGIRLGYGTIYEE